MPLTQAQINAIELLLNGDPEDENVKFVNDEINNLIETRDHLMALIAIHTGIADVNATTILSTLRDRAKTAADELVTLLT